VLSGKIATGTLKTDMRVRAPGNTALAGTPESEDSQLGKTVGSITGQSFTMKPLESYWPDPVQSYFVEEASPGQIIGFNVKGFNKYQFKQQKRHQLISDQTDDSCRQAVRFQA